MQTSRLTSFRKRSPISFTGVVVAIALLLGACASSAPSTGTDNAIAGGGPPFRNFLVIGIVGDYNSRAQFERQVVSELRQRNAYATTYYSIVGSNQPISRDSIRSAVQSSDFDAILVTRVLDTDVDLKVSKSREETDATPIGGRIINLFRSNYTDFKIPGAVDLNTRVTFTTELYSAAAEEIVWSIESSSGRESNLGLLIDRTAESIVSRLDREGAIRN